MFEIAAGEVVHCVELVSGRNLTGTFKFDANEIRTHVVAYDGHFLIDPDLPVFLLTEKNNVVSLYRNISLGSGRSSYLSAARSVHFQDITSDLAVIGQDEWRSDDRVRRVVFEVDHTRRLMKNRTKVDGISMLDQAQRHGFSIFALEVDGLSVGANYGARYSADRGQSAEIWPLFDIEFDHPQSLSEYLDHVNYYVQFLSFALGAHLKPSKISVSRLSVAEINDRIGTRNYRGDHDCIYPWPDSRIDTKDLWVGGSPIHAYSEDELKSFCECLSAWMLRYKDWRKACALMMGSLAMRREVSGNRLIIACKWFEEIPLAKTQHAIADDDVDAIASAANTKASELGYQGLLRRISGSLKTLKKESREQHFARLVEIVRARFGAPIFPDRIVDDLRGAFVFRGRSAHGHFDPKDDAEFRAFAKSTFAMEAMNYLLTALDLPVNQKGVSRMFHHPVVRDYLAFDRG